MFSTIMSTTRAVVLNSVVLRQADKHGIGFQGSGGNTWGRRSSYTLPNKLLEQLDMLGAELRVLLMLVRPYGRAADRSQVCGLVMVWVLLVIHSRVV